MLSLKLTAKSFGVSSLTKLTYPVSPGHLPFLSFLYSSHEFVSARADFLANRADGAKADVNATRATKRRTILANIIDYFGK